MCTNLVGVEKTMEFIPQVLEWTANALSFVLCGLGIAYLLPAMRCAMKTRQTEHFDEIHKNVIVAQGGAIMSIAFFVGAIALQVAFSR
ncbi:hypothetical protein OAN96_01385 [Candidatus Gracilibacteria bacterium]|nr:hypothetical protein [Candidatus Gracilibacteria bacterium]